MQLRSSHTFIAHPTLEKTMQQPVVPPTPQDLKEKDFGLSQKEEKQWSFEKDGKLIKGSKNMVKVLYGDPATNKLAFLLENVKSTQGIQAKDMKNAYMLLTLTPDQSAALKKYVDETIFALIWKYKDNLVKGPKVRKMTNPLELRSVYNGVVKDGQEKKDKTGTPQKGPDGAPLYWNDSISLSIPMTKNQHVDHNQCQILDLNNRPYAWTALENKMLREVVVEIDHVSFSSEGGIRVQCVARSIVPNEVGAGCVQYTTKRRLEVPAAEQQQQAATPSTTTPGSTTTSTAPTPAPESTDPAAKKAKA